jgi:hypothetical protein
MLFARIFAAVAVAATAVLANEEDTTTLTSTTTQTKTVTKCAPTKTDCPAYPLGNSTSSYYPTASQPSSYSSVVYVTPTLSSLTVVTQSTIPTTGPKPVTAGAGSVMVQGGLLFGAVGLGLDAIF